MGLVLPKFVIEKCWEVPRKHRVALALSLEGAQKLLKMIGNEDYELFARLVLPAARNNFCILNEDAKTTSYKSLVPW